jgi:hypothetical protein
LLEHYEERSPRLIDSDSYECITLFRRAPVPSAAQKCTSARLPVPAASVLPLARPPLPARPAGGEAERWQRRHSNTHIRAAAREGAETLCRSRSAAVTQWSTARPRQVLHPARTLAATVLAAAARSADASSGRRRRSLTVSCIDSSDKLIAVVDSCVIARSSSLRVSDISSCSVQRSPRPSRSMLCS